MLTTLAAIGRRSSTLLLLGLFVAAALPALATFLRPTLPALVSLALGLAIARLNIAQVLRDFANPRQLAALALGVLILMPVTSAIVSIVLRISNVTEVALPLAVFAAAPPISSAASVSLLLGYNARLTLQLTLFATLMLPVIGPLCLSFSGVAADLELLNISGRISLIILGGFAIGVFVQKVVGKAAIDRNPDAFNGVASIAMLLFLFPLFDGVVPFIADAPWQSLLLLILALGLNFGGNLAVRAIGRRHSDQDTIHALGLVFGNRNIGFFLAVLPPDPALSVFVAAAQIPIYATPALFARKSKRRPED